MSDDLSIQGTLTETTVPDLLRSLTRSGETAIVTLEGSGHDDTIYFIEGKIIFASSSDPDRGLAEMLLRDGELSLQQYNEAMENVSSSRRIGSTLCERGLLAPDELMHALEQQSSQIVTSALAWRTGRYNVEFSSEFPPEIVSLTLSTGRLLLDGVRAIENWSLIARGIGKPARMLQQVPGSDARAYSLDLTEEENHVHSLLAEPRSVGEICNRGYLSNFVTCRTLWALLVVNLIHDVEIGAVDEKRAAEETEFELEGLVESYNSAFQKIFRIVFQRIGDHIYDFIDGRVVGHLSPDLLPYLSGLALVNEGRVDFDQLFNNVIASGSGDRGGVMHGILNELLLGWIVEIKAEFGSEMEAQVMALASKLRRG